MFSGETECDQHAEECNRFAVDQNRGFAF